MDADGRFHRFSGEVRVDPNALDQAVVDTAIRPPRHPGPLRQPLLIWYTYFRV
ncbi:MAG: hypothetical protein HYV92_14270 [Candidatus Rokubacteria bacterium]|nr:hypothetical protein [Candidatus Rokubacteria bacterium]